MIITDKVLVQKDKRTQDHYLGLGYVLDKVGGSRYRCFTVLVVDLLESSRVRVDAECTYCGKVRSVNFYQYRECCHSCSNSKPTTQETKNKQSEQRKGKSLGAANPMWKGGKNTCITCSGLISNRVASQCKRCFLERDQYGENNPAWKDYTDAERETAISERKGCLARRWSKSVKVIAGFECDICCSNEKLHSHHLSNWRDSPDIRFDLSNGVCLCQNCHMRFHSIYGKKKNTPTQYTEFKESY